MATKKRRTTDPEADISMQEAIALASGVCETLDNHNDGTLALFVLLLRWMTYKATDDDRENVYIWAEAGHAASFDGVEEAIYETMRRELDAYRRRKKGGAR